VASQRDLPPAVLPAAGVAAGIAAGWYLPVGVSVSAALLLAVLGVALSRDRGGQIVVACGLGALAATVARERTPVPTAAVDHVVTLAGQVCGHPRPYAEGGAALTLCATRIRRGPQVHPGRWQIRLDLAPGVDPPPLGARVRATGSLGRSPGYDNAYRAPPGRWSLRVKAPAFLEVEAQPPWPLGWVTSVRSRLDEVWGRDPAARPHGFSLARTLVLGDAQALPLRWQQALRRTGLAHLVAVSGFNVALVLGAVFLVASPLPRPWALGLGATAAAFYLLLVGPEPSLVRATGMSLAAVAALFCRRSPASIHTLALTAVGMLIARPEVVEEVGFRLSVAATAGLLVLSPRLLDALPTRPAFLAPALAASIGAQLAALPVAAAAFGRGAPAAALLNLVFVPATALGLGAGLLSGLLGVAGDAGRARWLLPPLELAVLPFRLLERMPASSVWSFPVPRSLSGGAALAVVLCWVIVRPRVRRVAALAAALLAAGAPQAPGDGSGVELALLDVGQGDAILLVAPGAALLVDGGGARGRDLANAVLLPALARRNIWKLDAMVLTHADQDHCGGLADLAGWLPVGEVWLPAGMVETECTRTVAATAPIRRLERGDRVALGALGVEVLHPGSERGGGDNAVSLVLGIEAAGRRILLTGDLDGAGERRIAATLVGRGRVDVLKVSHHGSATSTTAELLDAIRPRLALISAGRRNLYGHPSPRALARLAERGVVVLRTDRDGEIAIRWRSELPLELSLPGSPRRSARDPPR